MTTIDPSLESELIRRFPFSPKVRPIALERLLNEELQAHHTKHASESDRASYVYHTPERVKINHAIELKTASTAEKSAHGDERLNSPSELAKLNAKLEEMLFRNSVSSHIHDPERKSLYESSIANHPSDNIIVRADNQIQKSQSLYTGNLSKSMTFELERELQMRIESKMANLNTYNYTFSPKKSDYGDDLLKVDDLKTSQIIENDQHLWATTDPEILRIIDEIRGRKSEVKIVTNTEKSEKAENNQNQNNDPVKQLEFSENH